MLILAAGDYNGDIVKDASEDYLKVDIGSVNKLEKSIVDTIPKLNEVRSDSEYPDEILRRKK